MRHQIRDMAKIFEGKTILLVNENKNLGNIFRKALSEEGFLVSEFHSVPFPEYKKDFGKKIQNLFSLKIKKDKGFYKRDSAKLKAKFNIKLAEKLSPDYDYVLVFRADFYPDSVLEILREKTRNLICYQYDGKKVWEQKLNSLKRFDKVFVFDSDDFFPNSGINFQPVTNCWFPDEISADDNRNDIFYVGVGVPERLKKIEILKNYCIENNIRLKAFLTVADYFEEKSEKGVSLVHQGLTYEENIAEVQVSKALLDFKLEYHKGLSFRFFEAMNFRKKIITNNVSAKDYDFYHPDNIFVTDYENLDGLKDFLEKPYHEIPEKIKEKYGFGNWIRYVLDSGHFQKIELPD